MKVKAASCDHVHDIKPGGVEYYHFVVEGNNYTVKMEKDWKFCPVCGKQVYFASAEKGGASNGV